MAVIVYLLLLILLCVAFVQLKWSIRFFLILGALIFLASGLTGIANEPLSVLSALVMGTAWMLWYQTPGLRQRILTKPLFEWAEKSMPWGGQVEPEPAGGNLASWEASLFNGGPDWNRLLAISVPTLSQSERAFVDGPVEDWCAEMVGRPPDQQPDGISCAGQDSIRQAKWCAVNVPLEYEGLGFSRHAQFCIALKLASCHGRMPLAAAMIPARLLELFGTEDQKYHYLPRIASGDEIPWLIVAENRYDATGAPQGGWVCHQPNGDGETLGFRVCWESRQRALEPSVTLLALVFHAYDPDSLLGHGAYLGVKCALVPVHTKGTETQPWLQKEGIPGSSFHLRGQDVFIPIECVIGDARKMGQCSDALMEALREDMVCYLMASVAGVAKFTTRTGSALSRVCRQFPLEAGWSKDDRMILAQIGGLTYLLDAGRILLNVEAGHDAGGATLSQVVGRQCIELSQRINHLAMSTGWGMAVLHERFGSHLGLDWQHLFGHLQGLHDVGSDSRPLFGLGMMRWHPSVRDEMQVCQIPDREADIQVFDEIMCRHLEHALTNKIRTFVLGLSRGRLAQGVKDNPVRCFSLQVDYLSAALAWIWDNVMVAIGRDPKGHVALFARLCQAFGYLYLASAAIWRFQGSGAKDNEVPLMEWACRYALFNAQQALDGVLHNFPRRFMGALLRITVFPTGRYQRLPDDQLHWQIDAILQTPGPIRDRLTEEVYLPDDPSQLVTQLETAFRLCEQSAAVQNRLHRSGIEPGTDRSWNQWLQGRVEVGDISCGEAELLRRTRQAVLYVLATGMKGSNEEGASNPFQEPGA